MELSPPDAVLVDANLKTACGPFLFYGFYFTAAVLDSLPLRRYNAASYFSGMVSGLPRILSQVCMKRPGSGLTEHFDFFEVTRCKFLLKPLKALVAVSLLLFLLKALKKQ
ncbi:hypothetical protein [Rouxiella chamberiensis]|uniref:hypothetical protein n=1 Tax=Rouxiella chamberiensis TaxID=1513468 RepID=UPI001650E09D|nr:hypothetical protein [Rouxiella chamberiensis]